MITKQIVVEIEFDENDSPYYIDERSGDVWSEEEVYIFDWKDEAAYNELISLFEAQNTDLVELITGDDSLTLAIEKVAAL